MDNWKEFTGHQRADQMLGSTIYIAEPFANRQWRAHENFNELIRQYNHQKTSTYCDRRGTYNDRRRLNNRPIGKLGLRTPNEVFHEFLNRVAFHVTFQEI